MSKASNLAGFVTSISPVNNLNVGVVTASGFVGNLTGTATGLSGSPNITVGVITATSYSGNGAGLTGVGIGTTGNVNTTGIGTFGTVVATADLDIPNGTTEQRPAVPVTGSIRYNSFYNWLEIYTGTEWGIVANVLPNADNRGVFGAGTPGASTIDYINISTTGNATTFGTLSVGRRELAACSSNTRGVFGGGYGAASPFTPLTSYTDYITISNAGNSISFGALSVARRNLAACSSITRGIFGGGRGASPTFTNQNVIDYITIATTGNAIDFGDLTTTRAYLAACSSSTRGVFGGGGDNTIDYITIATTGNATDFGDLTVARFPLAACSSSTRGVFGGGAPSGNTIDYITIASTGNATDFGDLTVAREGLAACSSSTRGVFGGGYAALAQQNVIDYITIASVGNATDFGDLTFGRQSLAACSNAHGGLA